jgi:HSP20 family molecular chaperone IbpA
LEEATLSAKWRRSKKYLKRFGTFETTKRTENMKTPPTLRFKNPKIKKRSHAYAGLPKNHGERKVREPGPLTDILEEKKEIVVIAEFAGFERENLKIHVRSQHLTLSAETSDQKYYKSLNLPTEVIPNSIRTAYKNGVLEIRMKKVIKEKAVDNIAGLRNAT